MTARILDGKATLAAIKAELTDRVAALASRGVVPGLGTVLVGDDPGSTWYVGAKHKDSAQIGVTSIRRDLPATATQAEVEAVIDELNADPDCTGFLVQQPTGLDEMALLSRVDPEKDIDGLHPTNLGWLVLGKPAPLPCTPMGCIELLRRFGVPIAGAHVVIVGRGITVGRPLGLMLIRKSENATVTICHTGTKDLAAQVREGDIVIMHIDNHSGELHPMHLHGHHAVVLTRNGVPATGSPWWIDSLNVLEGETYDIAFVANNPGIWLDHCHHLKHAAQGMVAHLMYEGVDTPYRIGGAAGNRPD